MTLARELRAERDALAAALLHERDRSRVAEALVNRLECDIAAAARMPRSAYGG